MGKLTFVYAVCLVVAASSLKSCCAARGLPHSLPRDQILSLEPTTIIPASTTIGSTLTESDEAVTDSDWEEFSESEELAACIAGADVGTEKFSLKEPCRRILQGDYGSPTTNKNDKRLVLRDGNGSGLSSSGPTGSRKEGDDGYRKVKRTKYKTRNRTKD